MSRDGSGNYSLPQAAFTAGTTIESAKVNSNFSDIASALTSSLAKDGQTTPTANLPMGTYRHTGVGDATARTHYAAAGQVADNSMGYAADTGSADAYAIAPAPGISAYAVGQRFTFKVTNANATTTPTLAVNGLTAGTIKWPDGSALTAGDLPANALVEVVVSATTPVFHLQSPGVRWPLMRGYLSGCGTARASTTTVTVAAGVAVDDTNVQMMRTSGATINLATTGANGLDAGSLANNTWYYVFVIAKTDGTVSHLASTSLSSPTYPTGYTLKRRIGSFRTNGSAQVIDFLQGGDYFIWASAVSDVNANAPGTSGVNRTLTVPTGLNVEAFGTFVLNNASVTTAATLTLTDIYQSGFTTAQSAWTVSAAGGVVYSGGTFCIRTNTSSQIRSQVTGLGDANVTLVIVTQGWYDTRGRFA